MKKFLTVLLVIAVMFTFSFSSAFAFTASDVVSEQAAALKVITDAADDIKADIAGDGAELIRNCGLTGTQLTAFTEAMNDAVAKAQGDVNTALTAAQKSFYASVTVADKELAGYIKTTGGTTKGTDTNGVDYYVATDSEGAKYVDVCEIVKANLSTAQFADTYLEDQIKPSGSYKADFIDDVAQEYFPLKQNATLTAIQAVDSSVYSAEKKLASGSYTAATNFSVDVTGKTHAEAADAAKAMAVQYVSAQTAAKTYTDMFNTIDLVFEAIYKVQYAGTEGETASGNLATFLSGLTKVKAETTEKAKVEYAKDLAYKALVNAINTEYDLQVATLKNNIWAENMKTKPNADKIKDWEEDLAAVDAEFTAMLDAWKYIYENAAFARRADGYYFFSTDLDMDGEDEAGDSQVVIAKDGSNGVPELTVNPFTYDAIFGTRGTLKAFAADPENEYYVGIAKHVEDLKADAESYKEYVTVDGDVYVDVDEALKLAIHKTYMTGSTNTHLTGVSRANYLAHYYIHRLINSGDEIDGKVYPAVEAWDDKANTTYYEADMADKVLALVEDTEDALKECKTVEEAKAAFLAAYAEFDAIPTKAEHDALFLGAGALVEAEKAARLELASYIDYKVALMGTDGVSNAAANIKAYFGIDNSVNVNAAFLEGVYTQADLDASVAEVKAAVDSLKTEKALKADKAALEKEIAAVAVPVTMEAKDAIVDLYNRVADHNDYADMVAGTATTYDVATTGIEYYVKSVADLEEAAMKAIVKEILADKKVTLEDKAKVEELRAAVDAYEALYVDDLETENAVPTLTKSIDELEDAIFVLECEAVEAAIDKLVAPTTAAQVAAVREAKAALDELGYEGLCYFLGCTQEYGYGRSEKLTKLNKFLADADAADIVAVESLKITASSKATKGAITVKWTVKGDKAAADGYQIYKSTKKNAGFKKMFTTKKLTYKNTKGLKKGVKYYYKVRAYKVVDGKKVYSDWSNKAIRVAK